MDVSSLFARAEQAFVAGRLDEARADLIQVRGAAGDHPTVLHLLALVEKKSGHLEAARAAFERATAAAPRDPQLSANFANLLGELGERERALELYARAVSADPSFAEARYNRALLLQKLGRLEEALADLDQCVALSPRSARAHSARGSVLLALRRLDEAALAYEQAIALAPSRAVALHGRARVAMERGEPEASAHYRRALAQRPDDLDLLLGLAEALEAEGDPAGLALLGETAGRHPDWITGQEALARMRSEAGDPEHFADHYEPAIQAQPGYVALRLSYCRTLMSGDRHALALEHLRQARPVLGDDPEARLLEALCASRIEAPEAALRLLDDFPGDEETHDYQIMRGRLALRARLYDEAARHLERAVEIEPGSIGAWANLDLAWRLAGDPRHDWLTGQAGLYGPSEIGLSAAEMEGIAERLRAIHRSRAHPIGQSLRGGTQTRGQLFARGEPELVRLREAIEEAVRGHVGRLPPADPTHPLLRHRDRPLKLLGSWSVRLAAQGFHINHLHPEGVLSSACYVSLPATIGGAETREGWLELGRPPRELDLPLEPIASIEPKVGRLALFPSYLYHGTRPFADGERLTVAFDVAPG